MGVNLYDIDDLDENLVGVAVKYVSSGRPALNDLIGKVAKITSTSAGVSYPDGTAEGYKGTDGLVWASRWAWHKVPGFDEVVADVDKTFTAAAGGPREIMMHEIERLEARIADLRKAVEVIDSL